MNKPPLQSVTDYKVLSFPEALTALGWTLQTINNRDIVTCNCEHSDIEYNGILAVEQIRCKHCGKEMIDLTAPIPTSSSTCALLDLDEFTIEKDKDGNDRFWIANDHKGGIKHG